MRVAYKEQTQQGIENVKLNNIIAGRRSYQVQQG